MAEFVAQKVGNETPNFGEGIAPAVAGASSAAALIQAKQHNEMLKEQIDQMKMKHEMGIQASVLDYYSRIAAAPNPAMKSALMKMKDQFVQKFMGQEPNPDMDKWLMNQPDIGKKIQTLQEKYPGWASNPEKGMQFRNAMNALLLSTDPASYEKNAADAAKFGTEIEARKIGAQTAYLRLNQGQTRIDEMNHRQVRQSVLKDKNLNDTSNQINTIQNTLSTLFNAKNLNTKSLMEAQQRLRTAFAGSTRFGVGERGDTYLNNVDTELAKLKEKFGDLNTIPKNSPIIKHLQDLSNNFLKEIRGNYSSRLNTLTSAMEHTYKNNPELAKDRDSLKAAAIAQIGTEAFKKLNANEQAKAALRQHYQAGTKLEDVNKAIGGEITPEEYDLLGKGNLSSAPAAQQSMAPEDNNYGIDEEDLPNAGGE